MTLNFDHFDDNVTIERNDVDLEGEFNTEGGEVGETVGEAVKYSLAYCGKQWWTVVIITIIIINSNSNSNMIFITTSITIFLRA